MQKLSAHNKMMQQPPGLTFSKVNSNMNAACHCGVLVCLLRQRLTRSAEYCIQESVRTEMSHFKCCSAKKTWHPLVTWLRIETGNSRFYRFISKHIVAQFDLHAYREIVIT